MSDYVLFLNTFTKTYQKLTFKYDMRQRKRTIFKFLIPSLILAGVFWACSHDLGIENPKWHQTVKEDDSDLVSAAKGLVNEMQGRVAMPDIFKTFGKAATRASGSAPQTLQDGSFTFEWEKSRNFQENDGEVLIVPVKMKRNVSVWRFSLIDNKGKKEQTPMYSVFYVKKFSRSGTAISRILSYAPARKHLRKFRGRTEIEWYNPTHTDYSGLLLVSSLDGILSHATNYENGHCEYIVRPNLHRHSHAHATEKTRAMVADSIQSVPEDSTTAPVSFFSMKTVTSDSSIRTYSYDDETYEVPGCAICGGDPYTCNCYEITACKKCGLEECNCACIICNQDPCVCEYCDTCFNLKSDCICPDDDETNPSGGGGTGGGGGTSGGSGGSSSGGSGGSSVGGGDSGGSTGGGGDFVGGVLSINITGGTDEQQDIIKNIINTLIDEYDLDFAGINIQIEDNGSCLSTARILPDYAGIGICPAFFNYSSYDQMAILWHETYHLLYDDRSWVEVGESDNFIYAVPPADVIEDIAYLIEEDYGYTKSDPEWNSIYLSYTYISDCYDPKFAQNEVNAYTAEKNAFPNVSERYNHVRDYMLWLYWAHLANF